MNASHFIGFLQDVVPMGFLAPTGSCSDGPEILGATDADALLFDKASCIDQYLSAGNAFREAV